jgi:hypothetical protein
MGIWHSRQATSLRGNRFLSSPGMVALLRSISFSTIFLKPKCATSMRYIERAALALKGLAVADEIPYAIARSRRRSASAGSQTFGC